MATGRRPPLEPDPVIEPDGTRSLRFVDVTEEAGIDVRSYGTLVEGSVR